MGEKGKMSFKQLYRSPSFRLPTTPANTRRTDACDKDLSGLDLSRCSRWTKFLEFEYIRDSGPETVTFLCPDVWNLMPANDAEWQQVRDMYAEEFKNKQTPVIKDDDAIIIDDSTSGSLRSAYDLSKHPPSLVVHASRLAKSGNFFLTTRSLADLLGQKECTREQTFELYLFAECLNGLLGTCHAQSIAQVLSKVQCIKGDGNRKRPGSIKTDSSPPLKRRLNPYGYVIETASTYSTKLPKVLFAISFFDRHKKRYLSQTDLSSILTISEYPMTRAEIDATVKRVCAQSNGADRFYYRNVTDVADQEEKKMCEFREGEEPAQFVMKMEQRLASLAKTSNEGALVNGCTIEYQNELIEMDRTLESVKIKDQLIGELELKVQELEGELRSERINLRQSEKELDRLGETVSDLKKVLANEDSSGEQYKEAYLEAKQAIRKIWLDVFKGSDEQKE
ncbi:hypothetical protein ACOME3_005027 [Neoechinorhynchus agilis]